MRAPVEEMEAADKEKVLEQSGEQVVVDPFPEPSSSSQKKVVFL